MWLDRAARDSLVSDDPQPHEARRPVIREQHHAAPTGPRPWRGALFDSD
jgi:hypothetical protein